MNANERIKKLGVGVIGTSEFTEEYHLQSLNNHPAVRLVAVCGRNRPKAQGVADRNGVERVYTDYHELIQDPDVDAVVIVTPNNQHHPMTMAVLDAGKHVFCEKPLGMDYQEAHEMYERAQALGVIHMTNFTFRGVPALMRMKELIDEGFVGRIYHIFTSFIGGFHRIDTMPWRRDKPQAGAGALGDLGSHVIDMSQWIAGPIAKVSAHMSTVMEELKLPGTGETVRNETDDTCAILAEFESGAQGILQASWVALPPPGRFLIRVEVHGDKGMLHVAIDRFRNPHSWVVLRGRQDSQDTDGVLPLPDRLTEGLDFSGGTALISAMTKKPWYSAHGFAEAVLGNREMSPSFYDGMTVQAVVDAAIASHQRGHWVDLG